jgi:hypothetical protein
MNVQATLAALQQQQYQQQQQHAAAAAAATAYQMSQPSRSKGGRSGGGFMSSMGLGGGAQSNNAYSRQQHAAASQYRPGAGMPYTSGTGLQMGVPQVTSNGSVVSANGTNTMMTGGVGAAPATNMYPTASPTTYGQYPQAPASSGMVAAYSGTQPVVNNGATMANRNVGSSVAASGYVTQTPQRSTTPTTYGAAGQQQTLATPYGTYAQSTVATPARPTASPYPYTPMTTTNSGAAPSPQAPFSATGASYPPYATPSTSQQQPHQQQRYLTTPGHYAAGGTYGGYNASGARGQNALYPGYSPAPTTGGRGGGSMARSGAGGMTYPQYASSTAAGSSSQQHQQYNRVMPVSSYPTGQYAPSTFGLSATAAAAATSSSASSISSNNGAEVTTVVIEHALASDDSLNSHKLFESAEDGIIYKQSSLFPPAGGSTSAATTSSSASSSSTSSTSAHRRALTAVLPPTVSRPYIRHRKRLYLDASVDAAATQQAAAAVAGGISASAAAMVSSISTATVLKHTELNKNANAVKIMDDDERRFLFDDIRSALGDDELHNRDRAIAGDWSEEQVHQEIEQQRLQLMMKRWNKYQVAEPLKRSKEDREDTTKQDDENRDENGITSTAVTSKAKTKKEPSLFEMRVSGYTFAGIEQQHWETKIQVDEPVTSIDNYSPLPMIPTKTPFSTSTALVPSTVGSKSPLDLQHASAGDHHLVDERQHRRDIELQRDMLQEEFDDDDEQLQQQQQQRRIAAAAAVIPSHHHIGDSALSSSTASSVSSTGVSSSKADDDDTKAFLQAVPPPGFGAPSLTSSLLAQRNAFPPLRQSRPSIRKWKVFRKVASAVRGGGGGVASLNDDDTESMDESMDRGHASSSNTNGNESAGARWSAPKKVAPSRVFIRKPRPPQPPQQTSTESYADIHGTSGIGSFQQSYQHLEPPKPNPTPTPVVAPQPAPVANNDDDEWAAPSAILAPIAPAPSPSPQPVKSEAEPEFEVPAAASSNDTATRRRASYGESSTTWWQINLEARSQWGVLRARSTNDSKDTLSSIDQKSNDSSDLSLINESKEMKSEMDNKENLTNPSTSTALVTSNTKKKTSLNLLASLRMSTLNLEFDDGNWLNSVQWDDEVAPSLPPITQLILDPNDEYMIFEDEPGSETAHRAYARLTKEKRRFEEKKKEVIIEEAGSDMEDEEVDPHNPKPKKKEWAKKIQRPKKVMIDRSWHREIDRDRERTPWNISNDTFYKQKAGARKLQNRVHVRHSVPAQKLHEALFRPDLGPADFSHWHRPVLRLGPQYANKYFKEREAEQQTFEPIPLNTSFTPILFVNVNARQPYQVKSLTSEGDGKDKDGKTNNSNGSTGSSSMASVLPTPSSAMTSTQKYVPKKLPEMSAQDGNIILLEYMEQYPNLVMNPGMGSRVITYYRKLNKDDDKLPEVEDGDVMALGDKDESPFMGDVAPGTSVTSINTDLFISPIFRHTVPSNDFLLIRTKPNTWYLREIPAVYAVGQQTPKVEVPAPSSKLQRTIFGNRVRAYIYRAFEKDPPHVKFPSITQRFGRDADPIARKTLSGCADKKDANTYVLRNNAQMTSQPCTPEQVCQYESMLVAQHRLQSLKLVSTCSLPHLTVTLLLTLLAIF